MLARSDLQLSAVDSILASLAAEAVPAADPRVLQLLGETDRPDLADLYARIKNTYLAAHHAHIRGRRGLPKAIGATRHDLLIAYWHVVHDQVNYTDLGPDWAHRGRSTEHRTRRLVHQLEQLGYTVTLKPSA